MPDRPATEPDEPEDADRAAVEALSAGWATALLDVGDAELTPLRIERRRLAAAVRQVIEAMASVDAPAEEIRVLADQLEAIAARHVANPPSTFEGFPEAANSPHPDGFFDRSPIRGAANPLAPPLDLTVEADRVSATAVFGSAYEGPPGSVHGGWVAAAFDEVLGAAQSFSGAGGMTAYLKVDYRSPTPLHHEVRFEGELDRVEGRKIFTRGRCFHGEVLTAEAEALFVTIDWERFDALRDRRA